MEKNEKFKSMPCEKFKDILKESKISFLSEYQPLENRHYSIDIAFPDKKIAIEINGNQHYEKDGKLKPYYQERHDNIESAGWKILEIRSRLVFNKEFIDKIIPSLKKDYNLGEFDYSKFDFLNFKKSQKKSKRKYGTKEDYINSKKQEYDELQKQKIDLLLNSNIEFSKYGWNKKASEILMILPQKIKKWMERYIPDFYKEKCFKRNSLDKYCSCGKKIRKKSQKCTTCQNLTLRKIPSIDQLKKDLEIMNKAQIAKKYKIRRTTLYKFMKTHNIYKHIVPSEGFEPTQMTPF